MLIGSLASTTPSSLRIAPQSLAFFLPCFTMGFRHDKSRRRYVTARFRHVGALSNYGYDRKRHWKRVLPLVQ
jgi:hypothetical protein